MQQQSQTTISLQVQAFQAGDIQGFNYFFDLHYATIYYFAGSVIKDQSIAEEITDDAFIKVWVRDQLDNTPAAIKSFLYQTLRNAF